MLKNASFIFMGFLLASGAINCYAVPAPKYLGIENFKLCLATQEINTYTAWCMPAGKPDICPETSWKQLKALSDRDKIPECPPVDAASATPAPKDKPVSQ